MSEPQYEQLPDDADVETPNAEQPRLGPPANSQITVERFPDGLTIQVPPAGLWRGTQGLFVFAIFWNAIVAAITIGILVALFGSKAKPDQSIWIAPLLLSIFWLVGIGVLLGSVNMARRRAAIAVTGGTLLVIQTGLFGSKQRDWGAGDVAAVRAGPSGMTVNDKPVLELQIFDARAAKLGLLAGRRDEELFWLADELRAALNVPEHAS